MGPLHSFYWNDHDEENDGECDVFRAYWGGLKSVKETKWKKSFTLKGNQNAKNCLAMY